MMFALISTFICVSFFKSLFKKLDFAEHKKITFTFYLVKYQYGKGRVGSPGKGRAPLNISEDMTF